MLSRTQFIIFESWDDHYKKHGYDTQIVIELFQDCGFEVYKLIDENFVSSN